MARRIRFERRKGSGKFLVISGEKFRSVGTRGAAIRKQEQFLGSGKPAVVFQQTSSFRIKKRRR